MTEPTGTLRNAGWLGILFVVVLFVQGGLVSLPTAAYSGEQIKAFYGAHAPLIVFQQLLGIASLLPFVLFALALGARNRLVLLIAVGWLAAADVLTNLIPLAMVVTNLSAGAAHGWTVAEDLADAALFVAVALFAAAATSDQPVWLRALGWLAAALALGRAILSPLGNSVLDAIAPLAFIAIVLALSVRLLLRSRIGLSAN